jgi:hypothetical protein
MVAPTITQDFQSESMDMYYIQISLECNYAMILTCKILTTLLAKFNIGSKI